MEKLKHTRLWTALHDLVDVEDCPKPDALLDDFVQELYTYCRSETIIPERTRSLNYVRNGLETRLEYLRNESKKKCTPPKNHQAVDVLC